MPIAYLIILMAIVLLFGSVGHPLSALESPQVPRSAEVVKQAAWQHNVAEIYVRYHPGVVGILPLAKPKAFGLPTAISCADAATIVTFVPADPRNESGGVAVAGAAFAAMAEYPGTGTATGGALQLRNGFVVASPCAIPDGAAVIVTRRS